MTTRKAMLVIAAWAACAATMLPSILNAAPLEQDALTISVAPTSDGTSMFVIAPKEGGGIVGGGIAVDKTGQIYLSDYGNALRPGSIYLQLLDGTRPPVQIMSGLVNPSDIEIAPDQKSLIIAGPDGRVERKHFGVSVRPFFSKLPRDPVAFLATDAGWLSARLSNDGYFHFPEVLKTQERTRVLVEIQDVGDVFTFYNRPLRIDAAGSLVGHSVIDVVVKN